jgi:hypothetical protein
MTCKPIAKDLVGVNVSSTLDGMSSIHIGIRDSETLESLNEPDSVDVWLMILTFIAWTSNVSREVLYVRRPGGFSRRARAAHPP